MRYPVHRRAVEGGRARRLGSPCAWPRMSCPSWSTHVLRNAWPLFPRRPRTTSNPRIRAAGSANPQLTGAELANKHPIAHAGDIKSHWLGSSICRRGAIRRHRQTLPEKGDIASADSAAAPVPSCSWSSPSPVLLAARRATSAWCGRTSSWPACQAWPPFTRARRPGPRPGLPRLRPDRWWRSRRSAAARRPRGGHHAGADRGRAFFSAVTRPWCLPLNWRR